MKQMLSFMIILVCLRIHSEAQVPNSSYELVWSDEFEGQVLDKKKWMYRSLGKRRDAYNVASCVTVQKGYLALRTEIKRDSVFTAMIATKGKYETTYGYFEIKCKLQRQEGHWSAFWLQSPLLGKFIGEPDKSGAEIDIYEFLPKKAKQIHHTLHYDGYKEHQKTVHKLVKNRRFDARNWHTFGLEWTPDSYKYYIDGKETFTIYEGISKINQYMIVSLEVGNWAGDIHNAKLPDYLIVDYVRVYKTKNPS